MSSSVWWWLMAAGMLFWLVGLHNRITRLRARAIDVLGALEKQVKACTTLLLEQPNTADQLDSTESDASDAQRLWMSAMQAAQQVDEVWGQVRKNTLSPEAQALRSQSWQYLQSAWVALLNSPPDLAGAAVPDELRNAWEPHASKALAVQNAFNGIIKNYNECLQEYPARMVVRRMGFELSDIIKDIHE